MIIFTEKIRKNSSRWKNAPSIPNYMIEVNSGQQLNIYCAHKCVICFSLWDRLHKRHLCMSTKKNNFANFVARSLPLSLTVQHKYLMSYRSRQRNTCHTLSLVDTLNTLLYHHHHHRLNSLRRVLLCSQRTPQVVRHCLTQ